jgi:hypothetical protein
MPFVAARKVRDRIPYHSVTLEIKKTLAAQGLPMLASM